MPPDSITVRYLDLDGLDVAAHPRCGDSRTNEFRERAVDAFVDIPEVSVQELKYAGELVLNVKYPERSFHEVHADVKRRLRRVVPIAEIVGVAHTPFHMLGSGI